MQANGGSPGFESGSLTPAPPTWSGLPANSQNLSVSTAAAYWGVYGLAVTVSGQDTYVEDNSPLSEGEYHARFYVNPNGVTIGSGQTVDLFDGYSNAVSGSPVFQVQMQESSGAYQVRIGASGAYSTWYTLASGWNAIEIEYTAVPLYGEMNLYVGGNLKGSLGNLNDGGSKVDLVRLGALNVQTANPGGTLYFDDFDSRRFSSPGLLPNPGTAMPTPTPVPGMTEASYTYTQAKPHAVLAVTTTGSTPPASYSYDANGNPSAGSGQA